MDISSQLNIITWQSTMCGSTQYIYNNTSEHKHWAIRCSIIHIHTPVHFQTSNTFIIGILENCPSSYTQQINEHYLEINKS